MGKTSSLASIESKQLCIDMLHAGFKNCVIEIATGTSNSMVRKIRKELDLPANENLAGALKIAPRIVENRRRIVDAGMVLQLYLKCAKQPKRSIDYRALMAAHALYLEVHLSIYGHLFNELDINESYVLVRDYRSNNGSIELHKCTCGADYITVSEQRMQANCPLCTLERKENSLSDEHEEDVLDDLEGELFYDDSDDLVHDHVA